MKVKIVMGIMAMFFITALASAGTISYTDVSCLNSGSSVCSSSVFIYYPNGTLAGSLNGTNDAITYDESQAINIYLKPNSVSLLNNPSFFFQWMLNTWQLLFVILLIMAVVVGFIIIIIHLFRNKREQAPKIERRRW